jgi:hypothetical protein
MMRPPERNSGKPVSKVERYLGQRPRFILAPITGKYPALFVPDGTDQRAMQRLRMSCNRQQNGDR